MNPAVMYMLARLGLFVLVLIPLWFVPNMNPFLKLMIALVVSFLLSWFLLRGMRDKVADQVGAVMDRRKEQKDRLRDALAGDKDTDATDGGTEDKR